MHRRAVAAVVLLGLVVLTTVGILIARAKPDPLPPEPPQPAVQQTLLVQVRDKTLLASGSTVMANTADSLSQLFWTGDWWVDQEGKYETSAADLGRKPLEYVMDTVGRQTGVAVTDAWVLDRLAMAGLVDSVGGVRLRFDKPVLYVTEGGEVTLIPVGTRTLVGAAAADFIMDTSLRDEAARQQRFQMVWEQVLRRFPTDQGQQRTLLISLGALSKSTMTPEELAEFLHQASLRLTAGRTQDYVLPLLADNRIAVRPPQGVTEAHALDAKTAAGQLRILFAGFPAPTGETVRVFAAAPRSAALATTEQALDEAGWTPVWGGRTAVAEDRAVVRPAIPPQQISDLEAAVGVPAERGAVPLSDAAAELSASSQTVAP